MNGYRYYAFVDLLGYRQLIEEDLKLGQQELRKRLTASFDELNDVNEADLSLKAISDSIFVSLNNHGLGFSYIAKVLQRLQVSFLRHDLLVRGGVSYAEHFEHGKVTYSPALIEAYKLESSRAFFPRILVHEAVIEKLRNEKQLDQITDTEKLIVAHGGTYQIHFLTEGNWNDCYTRARGLAKANDRLIRSDPHVYAKHWYLQEYLFAYKPKGKIGRRYLPGWGDTRAP